jgi:lysophospholipase L1-like esterase
MLTVNRKVPDNRWPPQRRRTVARFVLVAMTVILLLGSVSPSAAAAPDEPAPITVMPLGDSLTDGYNIPGGYRVDLAERFADDDLAIDLVGSLSNGPASLTDREPEGHSGFRIDEIAASLPTSHLIVASIPQILGSPYAERIEAFNADVPGVVSSKIDEGKQVSYVDMYSVTEVSDLHTDYTHMNATGYCKLADAWFVAIHRVLGDGPETSAVAPTRQPSCALP